MISTLILFIPINTLTKIFKTHKQKKEINTNSRLLNIFIICFLIIQMIIPFRHVFVKGHVDYNGIGQRFSWRMKSMCKNPTTNGIIEFYVIEKKSKQQIALYLRG